MNEHIKDALRYRLLPFAHPGECTWLTHPTHRLRQWFVYLLSKATRGKLL